MKKKINGLKLNSILTMLLVFIAFSFSANSKTITWTGAKSVSWSNVDNWNGGLPSAGDKVVIKSNANQPVLDKDATIASLSIDGKGLPCFLRLDGIHTLTVDGNVVINHKNTDKIRTSSSIIVLANGGGLSGEGEIDLSGDGKLFISGDLTIADLIANSSTGSTVVFNGSSQKINNGRKYHFNDLNIHSGYTDLVHTNLIIDGDLLGGGTLNGENNKIQLAGDMMLVSFKPGKSTFELASGDLGSACIQHLNANTFYILENFDQKTVLSGPIKVVHQLDFEKGNIYLGYSNVKISNGVKLTRGGDKEMTHSEAGSKGYFITDGTGTVNMTGSVIHASKTRSVMIMQFIGCDLGLVEN